MNIFTHYTGSALSNNALMTVEALACLTSVEEITPDKLLQLCKNLINEFDSLKAEDRYIEANRLLVSVYSYELDEACVNKMIDNEMYRLIGISDMTTNWDIYVLKKTCKYFKNNHC